MPDSKITALTSISTSTDPANDPLVIVDVSDTSMAATGTTKKVTLNQLLGASGTATLASATITGGLTIGGATSFPAGIINTSGGNPVFAPTAATNFLYTGSTSLSIRNQANTQEIFNLTPAGVYTFGDGAGGTRMTLNATGLGVGVAPGSGKIAARAGTAATGNSLYADNIDGTYNPWIQIQHSSAGIKIFNSSSFGGSSNNLIFGNGTTSETMRIDSSGNVGIGVTPSAWATYKAIQIGSGGGGFLYGFATSEVGIGNSCYYNAGWKYLTNTDKPCWFSSAAGAFYWNTANTGTAGNAITFTQAMTLDASGRLLVGPTSANASGGVLQLSSGITFPATQVASSDANTLDDYEEGTFTPAITGTVTAGVGTYSNQIGRYTKVGNQVTVWIRLSWSAHTGSGDMTITGLPFTLANVNNLGAGAAIGYTANISITAGNYLMVYGDSGFARAYFWQTPTGGGSTNTVAVDASGDIGLTMTYFV